MSKKKNNGDGPGLAGLFTSGEPAYRYMGPVDMSAVGFTESALNRAVKPNERYSEDNIDLAPYNVLAMKDEKNKGRKLATGERFVHNAKFLNDIYDLTKRLVSDYSPDIAKLVAPLVLTDKIADEEDLGVMAYFDPDSRTITHPVYDELNTGTPGYYRPKSKHVVAGSRTESPQMYSDYYVNQMTGEKVPVISSAIPHEIAHSLDFLSRHPLSVYDSKLRSYMVKDMYQYPRSYNTSEGAVPVTEVFAEYMTDAMRTGLGEKSPQLQAQYESEGLMIPYERIASREPMRFTTDTPETRHMMQQLDNAAASESKNPYTRTPLEDAGDVGDKAGMKSAARARSLNSALLERQSDPEYAKESRRSKRAKSHLDFLDWYFPYRIEE